MLEPNREGECKGVSEGTATSSPVGRRTSAVCPCACVLCRLWLDVASWQLHQLGAHRAGLCWVTWCLAGLRTSSAAMSLSLLLWLLKFWDICCPELCPSVWDHENSEKSSDLLEGERTCGRSHKCPCFFCCTLCSCAWELLSFFLILFSSLRSLQDAWSTFPFSQTCSQRGNPLLGRGAQTPLI